jgi:hypothetical protein
VAWGTTPWRAETQRGRLSRGVVRRHLGARMDAGGRRHPVDAASRRRPSSWLSRARR